MGISAVLLRKHQHLAIAVQYFTVESRGKVQPGRRIITVTRAPAIRAGAQELTVQQAVLWPPRRLSVGLISQSFFSLTDGNGLNLTGTVMGAGASHRSTGLPRDRGFGFCSLPSGT